MGLKNEDFKIIYNKNEILKQIIAGAFFYCPFLLDLFNLNKWVEHT